VGKAPEEGKNREKGEAAHAKRAEKRRKIDFKSAGEWERLFQKKGGRKEKGKVKQLVRRIQKMVREIKKNEKMFYWRACTV